jgi:hypothetical protein
MDCVCWPGTGGVVRAISGRCHYACRAHFPDVVHGLSIDGYKLATTADPGQTARLTFVADRRGSFRFRCTMTCGNLHPFMIGKLQVGQNTLLWRAILLSGLALVGGTWILKK